MADRWASLTLLSTDALTVRKRPDFVEQEGMLGLPLDGNRARVMVNRGAAEAAGLSLCAGLLRVAVRVLPGHRPS